MPRSFDSSESPAILTFTENVQCPHCGEIFEGQFLDQAASLSVQDMVEPPSGVQQCPECGYWFDAVMSGWMLYGEAG